MITLLAGLALLVGGAELLVRGAGRVAIALRVPVMVVALTIVAGGTSMPEILVSLQAALAGSSDIALANVTGSNICNIALVLGASAMVSPVMVGRELMRRELPAVALLQGMVPVLGFDGSLSRVDGALLLVVGLAYNAMLVRDALAVRRAELSAGSEAESVSIPWNLALFVAGLALLFVGSEWFVAGAVALAANLGLDERVIGLTVVAVGTSTPEIVTSLLAAWRGDSDMAVGNVLGSNIINITLALGLTAMIYPIGVGEGARTDMAVALAVSFALAPLVHRGREISRAEGAVFVGGYMVYLASVAL